MLPRELVFVVALLLAGCEAGRPTSNSPQYLKKQMQENPPQADGLTAYATNGPYETLSVDHLAVMRQTLFASTQTGVYRSEDKGTTWHQSSIGLGLQEVEELAATNTAVIAIKLVP